MQSSQHRDKKTTCWCATDSVFMGSRETFIKAATYCPVRQESSGKSLQSEQQSQFSRHIIMMP